jgi:hypothetical protein
MVNTASVDPAREGQNSTVALVDKWLYELVLKHEVLESKFATLINELKLKDAKIEDLTQKLDDLKNQTPAFNQPGMSFADIMDSQGAKSDNEVVIIAKMNKEQIEKKKIEKNIIISGLKEPSIQSKDDKFRADKEQIIQLLNILGVPETDLKKHVRLTKKVHATTDQISNQATTVTNDNIQPDLVLIELSSKEAQTKIVKNSKKLKDSANFNSVYVNFDKTENERILEKKLRVERNSRNSKLTNEVAGSNGRLRYNIFNGKKYYWGIRSGDLIWIELKQTL